MPGRPLFPVTLRLEGRRCLVVGPAGDAEVLARSAALRECGALVEQADPGELDAAGLRGVFLVCNTVRDAAVAARLDGWSTRYGCLLWCMDEPEFGNVAMTAVARAGLMRVAVSTSGAAPAIASAFRRGLETGMGDRLAAFVASLAVLREQLRKRYPGCMGSARRIAAMLEASRGFAIKVEVAYPKWFESGEEPLTPEATCDKLSAWRR